MHLANRGMDKGAEIQVKETTEKRALQQTRDREKLTHRMNSNPIPTAREASGTRKKQCASPRGQRVNQCLWKPASLGSIPGAHIMVEEEKLSFDLYVCTMGLCCSLSN